jgi:hypothetical protein
MIDVQLPGEESVPEVVRSFAACIASVTETPVAEVLQPESELRGAIAHWRSWLAGRGAGLVPIADATRFQLAGPLPGGTLGCAEARRNVVTRGVDLNALEGRRFRVGGRVPGPAVVRTVRPPRTPDHQGRAPRPDPPRRPACRRADQRSHCDR